LGVRRCEGLRSSFSLFPAIKWGEECLVECGPQESASCVANTTVLGDLVVVGERVLSGCSSCLVLGAIVLRVVVVFWVFACCEDSKTLVDVGGADSGVLQWQWW